MAKKKPFIKLQCEVCKRINYFTHKSKGASDKKLKLKKFCKWCRKHTVHKGGKEVKKWGRGEMAIMEISKISVPGSNPGVPANK